MKDLPLPAETESTVTTTRKKTANRPRKAVILAGGLGSRLRPFTNIIPKPLLPIGEKAILEIQIERLAQNGFTDVYLATNYKADYIERFLGERHEIAGVKLEVSREEEPLGTAGPLRLLADKLDDTFLVMNGDILTLANFDKFYTFADARDELLSVGIKQQIYPFQFGNVYTEGDFVVGVEEKPELVTYILSGIYLMKPGIMSFIPQGKRYGIDELIKDMLAAQEPISQFEITEYWLDIGRQEDYQKAQADYDQFFTQ